MTLDRVLLCFLVLLSTPFSQNSQADETEDRLNVVAELREKSDEQLVELLSTMLKGINFRRGYELKYEPCLLEIARRGGPNWEEIISNHLQTMSKRQFLDFEFGDEKIFVSGQQYSLELLTTLRRIQSKPDPLTIVVEKNKNLPAHAQLDPPKLLVQLKNVDVGKQEFGIQASGDYRSGRQARWKIELLDEKGNTVPVKRLYGSMFGGGIHWDMVLKLDDTWKTVLDTRVFIESPAPGKYVLQVFYHDRKTIVDSKELTGLIIHKSKKIEFVVLPTLIRRSEQQQTNARKLIQQLELTSPVKLVAGSYGKWAHEFVAPDSTEGQLLTMGLPAVPALIEALNDKATSTNRLARIFCMLHTITGLNDPRFNGAIGSCKYYGDYWTVRSSQTDDENSSYSAGYASKGSTWAKEIDVVAQRKLVKSWTEWLQTVKIEDID